MTTLFELPPPAIKEKRARQLLPLSKFANEVLSALDALLSKPSWDVADAVAAYRQTGPGWRGYSFVLLRPPTGNVRACLKRLEARGLVVREKRNGYDCWKTATP